MAAKLTKKREIKSLIGICYWNGIIFYWTCYTSIYFDYKLNVLRDYSGRFVKPFGSPIKYSVNTVHLKKYLFYWLNTNTTALNCNKTP